MQANQANIKREVVAYLKDMLIQNGPMTVELLRGSLSQATEGIREIAGKTKEGFLDFLKGHPYAFTVSKKGVVYVHHKEESKNVDVGLDRHNAVSLQNMQVIIFPFRNILIAGAVGSAIAELREATQCLL